MEIGFIKDKNILFIVCEEILLKKKRNGKKQSEVINTYYLFLSELFK